MDQRAQDLAVRVLLGRQHGRTAREIAADLGITRAEVYALDEHWAFARAVLISSPVFVLPAAPGMGSGRVPGPPYHEVKSEQPYHGRSVGWRG